MTGILCLRKATHFFKECCFCEVRKRQCVKKSPKSSNVKSNFGLLLKGNMLHITLHKSEELSRIFTHIFCLIHRDH